MPEPITLAIAVACTSLISNIVTLSKQIVTFVSDFRDARKDMDAVSRELSSLSLCIEGLRESDICVGDVHRIGSSRLQVCQPRQPCFKLALRFSDNKMPKAMIRTGRAGWYYRILEPGVVNPGDRVEVLDRLNPTFPFTRLVELISRGKASTAELEQMRDMPGLAQDWQQRAVEMLAR